MPYIKEERRFALGSSGVAENPGELNYLITQKITDYLNKHGESYTTFNDIVGALENAKLELYRRMIVPYENKAIDRNGDVYE